MKIYDCVTFFQENLHMELRINILKNVVDKFIVCESMYDHRGNKKKINFSKNDELEIFCIPPWLIEKVETEIDHFHNAASFVEMPQMIIKNYVKFINKFKTKEISLISYDGFDLKTTFNPEELNSFFDNELKISWKNYLIDDHRRKLIYLISNK